MMDVEELSDETTHANWDEIIENEDWEINMHQKWEDNVAGQLLDRITESRNLDEILESRYSNKGL